MVHQVHHREDGLGEHPVLLVQLPQPVDQLRPIGLSHHPVPRDIVVQPSARLLLSLEELHVVVEVVRHHLGVALGDRHGRHMHRSGPSGGAGDLGVEGEAVLVEGGVAAAGFLSIGVGDVGDFLAEDAVLHVSVRLNNYN